MHRSTHPRHALATLATLATAGLLAACGDGGTAPRSTPSPPPIARAKLAHRADATLDSLFGADAATLDSALAAEGRALDVRAAAWVDSVVTALVPDAPPEGATAVPAAIAARRWSSRTASETGARAEGTFAARATVPTRGGLRTVRLDFSYHLTVTAERIQLNVVEADVVHDGSAVGTPLEQDFASYTRIASREMTVVPCPDAAGRSAGTWKGEVSSYGARASRAVAGPERWTFKTVERSVATPVLIHVDDAAYRESFDYHFAYDIERQQGSTYMTGGAEARRSAVPIVDVVLELGDDALTSVTGDYRLLADKLGAGDLRSLHFSLGDDLLRTSAAAQRVWRGGGCVEVQEPGGPVQPASPGAQMTLRPVVVHRQDGTRPAVPVEARAAGGAVAPEGVLTPAPAAFAYTASPTGAGRVTFRTVSKRGIGTGAVAFSPLETGATFDYQSTTEYAIESRDPLGEVTTGSMRGTQRLESRLTLAPDPPDEGDDRAFTLVAVTDVRAAATGGTRTRGPEYADYDGETGFTLSAVGTSSDPGAANGGQDHVHPEQFTVDPEVAGRLKLFRRRGRDYYAFDIGLSGVVATYAATARMREVCDETVPPSTSRIEYDNRSRRYTRVAADPGSCWPAAGDGFTRERPYAFGAIGLDRTRADPETGRSELFIGTYDARTGLIEGSESVTVRDCPAVRGRDPLQLASVLHEAPSWKSPPDLDQGRCTLEYTVRWRFLVPPR